MGIEDVVVSEWRVSQSVLTNPMHFLEKTEKNAVGIGRAVFLLRGRCWIHSV